MDECKHSSKASGATPAGALTRLHGGNFTHSRIRTLCRPARTPSVARRRHAQRRHHGPHRQLGVATSLLLQQQTPILDRTPLTMLPKASLRPRRANQDHRGQHPSHTLGGLSLCRADAHLYTLGLPLREEVVDFIALCKQRLQRVTGLKPSKSTNALPPAWQFSLSWGGVNADEEHRVLGRHYGQAARDCEEQPLGRTGPAGCHSHKLSSSFSSTKDFAGGKLVDITLYTTSPKATLSPRGTMRRTAAKPGADAMVRRLKAPSG